MSGEPILGNGIIPRLAFITIIIIAFYILLRIGLVILAYFYGENKSPHLIDGMVKSNNYRLIKQNPTLPGSKPVYRSDNENTGGEYTWSVWLYMDQAQSLIKDGTDPVPYHIFSKGTKQLATVDNNRYPVTNGPGLYLVPSEDTGSNEISHDLYILLDTYGNGDDDISGRGDEKNSITITDVPLKKWVNIIIRAQHKTIDVFINGVLSRRKIYSNVIKQNYGDIFVGARKNPLDGYISSLRYFNYALGNNQIQDIMNMGPNLKTIGEDFTETKPPYLAMRWYLDSHN